MGKIITDDSYCFGDYKFKDCCFDGEDELSGNGICACCIPGLMDTLQFADDNSESIAIGTIGDKNQSTDGTIIPPITELVYLSVSGVTRVYSLCTIETITFKDLTPTEVSNLLSILTSRITPPECADCCSNKLREYFDSHVTSPPTPINRIDTHFNNIITSGDILGTGQGVVMIDITPGPTVNRDIIIINLCYVSEVIL